MAGQQYKVSAVPFESHEQYFAAGFRFTTEPVTVTITETPKEPYEITQEQFETLRQNPRIRVEGAASAPAPAAVSESDDGDNARAQRRR